MTRWSNWQQTYRWLLFPRKTRFPQRWSHWLPLPLTVVLVAGVFIAGPWLFARITCRPGLVPKPHVWSQDGECVGLSDGGPYAFGLSAFNGVFQQIARQNAEAGNNPCGTGAAPVTIGVLVALTSPTAGGRTLHQLEGFAAGQAKANNRGCVHPIKLRVAQMGKNEQAAVRVAQLVADSPDIVAVVGMGQSYQQSAQAVQTLADHQIPMVDDVITAEGFDQNGSSGDHPDFSTCADPGVYDRGIGLGFFYRVAYRVATQATELGKYLHNTANFIITPTTPTDPFTCTALPLLHRAFEDAHELRFDPADPTTVQLSVQQLCYTGQEVTAVYAARAQDLSRFLIDLDAQYQNGNCHPNSITVVSLSDASRIRAPEPDPNLEALRVQALTSTNFTNNKVRIAYTPLANPEVLLTSNKSEFSKFEKNFGFEKSDLDDGWVINAYDALTTVAAAVNIVPSNGNGGITRSEVNTAIGTFSSGNPVPSAEQGPLTFDDNGNRNGSPVVVRVCPATGRPPHSTTAEVYPSPVSCP